MSSSTLDKEGHTSGTATTKRAIVFLKDKGGTGASFLARFIGEQLRERKPGTTTLVDGDGTVGSLFKFLAVRGAEGKALAEQGDDGVETFALHGGTDDCDELVNVLLPRTRDTMLIDLPATALTTLRNAEYSWAGCVRAAGYRITVVSSITPYDDSIYDLQDARSLVGDADYVAVVNLGQGEDRGDWQLWDDSETRKSLLASGGVEVEFPRLRARIAARLARHRLSFRAGVASPHLTTTDRSRLATWIERAEAAVAPAVPFLGLA